MSDVLEQAPFLSSAPPVNKVLDYSKQLSKEELANLEEQCQSVHYSPIVVVLPKNFSPAPSTAEFARQLAGQWHLKNKGFLLVVDLKQHSVRALSGNYLEAQGLNGSYLSTEILKQHFVPYIKQGDLYSAISNTLTAVDGSLAQVANSQVLLRGIRTHSGARESFGTHGTNFIHNSNLILLLVLAASLIFVFWSGQKRKAVKTKELFEKLQPQLNELYKKSDEIGQASEYLRIEANPELAQKIALYFNRVSALNAAQKDLDRLYKNGKIAQSGDAVMKIGQMVAMLEPESQELLQSVNHLTGAVGSYAKSPELVAAEFEESAKNKVAANKNADEGFKRPSWAYEPAYYQPVIVNDHGAGLMNLMLLMNQMQMSNRLDQMAYGMNTHIPEDTAGQSSSWGDGGASWSNSSSDQSSDFGGSSDWSGSDGGADWGGGGGGDGGGDW